MLFFFFCLKKWHLFKEKKRKKGQDIHPLAPFLLCYFKNWPCSSRRREIPVVKRYTKSHGLLNRLYQNLNLKTCWQNLMLCSRKDRRVLLISSDNTHGLPVFIFLAGFGDVLEEVIRQLVFIIHTSKYRSPSWTVMKMVRSKDLKGNSFMNLTNRTVSGRTQNVSVI